ncbi:leucyl aminopeptidase [Pseudovibrio hongkongensis]|uniref:leucyl aminopeptidase n=1 Tax=Polycladidibacter hongkongensis TaxID=1647556 RepID=UPI00082BA5DD|nr:leucyl aminopeptidase [Pseudovibrio hongkongensis]
MAKLPEIALVAAGEQTAKTLVVLLSKDMDLSQLAGAMDKAQLEKAIATAKFKGKKESFLHILAPAGSEYARVLLAGFGAAADMSSQDWVELGGAICGKLQSLKVEAAAVLGSTDDAVSVALAEGALLRGYKFDAYKTKRDDEEGDDAAVSLQIVCADKAAARALWQARKGVAEGVLLAREVVNLPPNDLGPVEFAQRAADLAKLGVEVEILDEEQMQKLGMQALLGVGQGSVRPSRLAIMKWAGGKAEDAPIAFVGKGVVFDSGGISIKPGAGMDEMKGDMGGAGAVIGLMHALAARKAPVHVVGILGLVENMPDGNAQRPGDIVTTMSGQTIEILNTDAEGRLVLADALWYTNERFKPKFIIDLATLTGACMIALGNHHAGLFSNDDELAAQIDKAGADTSEKVWRLPLGKEYDKMIDTPNADMRNTGGSRLAGATTAAQLLQRFIGETPWAHIDIAGTAMGSPKTAISQGWASGFGVRLLDKLVKDNFES